MITTQLNELSQQQVEDVVSRVSFFKQLRDAEPEQLALLLKHSLIVVLDAGELIIEQGSCDHTFYSVVKGKLDVFTDGSNVADSRQAVGHVSAGQVLGGLSLINNKPRSATLVASQLNGATLLATDYKLFGELGDFHTVSLACKLALYRQIVQHTHWKLDEYRHNSQNEQLTSELQKLGEFLGDKGSLEELQFLADRAEALGILLHRWNDVL